MNNLLVSVIITTKNSSSTLINCLESIKKQTYKNIEIILVDNNSIDRTKEIASKYIIISNVKNEYISIKDRVKTLLFLLIYIPFFILARIIGSLEFKYFLL